MPRSHPRHGGFRWTDPATAIHAAMTVNVGKSEYAVMQVMLVANGRPINGWEISRALRWATISVVPRLAPLRRKGMIEQKGVRPGPPPTRKSQIAYVITTRGRAFMAHVARSSGK